MLMAPDAVRTEWTAALQLELAARGALAIPAEPPDAESASEGDAQARRLAVKRGAHAAVWPEPASSGFRLRMITTLDDRLRVVDVDHGADPRTVALIIVGLLDHALEMPDVAGFEAGASATPDAAFTLADPSQVVVEGRNLDAAPEPRREPYLHWSGLVGLAGLIYPHDGLFELGLAIRGGIAMRYEAFELAILNDAAIYHHHARNSYHPILRTCVEGGAATPREAWAFHAGLRACGGIIFIVEEQDIPEFRTVTHPSAHFSGGAYAAISFELERWIRLFIRADFDLGWTRRILSGDAAEGIPFLSAILSFE